MDISFKILFDNKDISEEVRAAILALILKKVELSILTTFRFLESDLYKCEGYTMPEEEMEKYGEDHPEYR